MGKKVKLPVGTTKIKKSCKKKNKHTGEGIRAFVDYFEIVPGSNLVTEHLDCMTPTSPACPVSGQLASALSSRTRGDAWTRAAGTGVN